MSVSFNTGELRDCTYDEMDPRRQVILQIDDQRCKNAKGFERTWCHSGNKVCLMTTEPLISNRENRLLQPFPSTIRPIEISKDFGNVGLDVNLPSRTTMDNVTSIYQHFFLDRNLARLTLVCGGIFGGNTILEFNLGSHFIARAVLLVALFIERDNTQ